MTDWAAVVPWLLAPSIASLVDLFSLFSTLSKAHLGYLHLVRAFLRGSFSCWSISGLLHTVVALWERVWMTLNLAERWWWLSHCKYWSVCVGFLYIVIESVLLASGLTVVSKKDMEPSSLLFSTVNFIARSTLLMCWRKPSLLTSLWMTKVSSTNLHQNLGGFGAVLKAFCSKYSMYRLATIGQFSLPHIWDRVLLNTKGLNLKRQVSNNNTQLN